MKYKVASLFSGIGGIDLGFQQAGFEIVWANEIDSAACKTYRHNFGNDYLVEGDIKKINSKDIPNFDILVAGFPCQPFSLAGKQKGFKDDRGQLFFEIERLIIDKQPQIVFLENVANLIKHNKGRSFEQVFLSLASHDYVVRYSTLNPKTHANIPQQRDRIFLVAFKDMALANKFVYPNEIQLTNSFKSYIDINEKHDEIYYYNEKHTLFNQMQKKLKQNMFYRISDFGINKGSNICPTLTANMGTFPDRVHIIRDNFGVRKLTPYECLQLQGFPKGFSFSKGTTLNQAYKQIGNSVCVPIIYQIAIEIKKVITNKDNL